MPKQAKAGPKANEKKPFYLIQVLRGVAALLVVAQHATLTIHERDHIGPASWINGGAGVDIFFVISGFVMMISSAPLRSAAHPARTFLARRIERIVPMYWLVTTAKVLAVLAAPALALNGLGSLWHVAASYLFLPARNLEGILEPVIVVGWTLNFEMMFYVLFAAALAAVWMRGAILKVIAPVLLLLSLLCFFPQYGLPGTFSFYEDTIVLEFLMGILLAMALPWVRRLPSWAGAALLIAGLLPLLFWTTPNTSPWRGLLWGPAALAVVAGAVALEQRWGRSAPSWTLELGDASYSIYLIHGFVLPVVGILLVHVGRLWRGMELVSIVVVMAISALCGEVAYRLVERPIAQWFKGRRKTAIPANAS